MSVAASAPTGQWLGREGFVAEAAVQLDRLTAQVARLERELEKSRAAVAEMAEEKARERRFQAFEETLKNSRDYKITDLQRACKDLKARLDVIEGNKTTFLGLSFKSFASIDKKLAELSGVQFQMDEVQRAARRNEVLFFGALALAAVSLASRFIF